MEKRQYINMLKFHGRVYRAMKKYNPSRCHEVMQVIKNLVRYFHTNDSLVYENKYCKVHRINTGYLLVSKAGKYPPQQCRDLAEVSRKTMIPVNYFPS